MRYHIISDTTRSYTVVFDPFNSDDDLSYGYYVAEYCPVNGHSLPFGPFETEKEARDMITAFMKDFE